MKKILKHLHKVFLTPISLRPKSVDISQERMTVQLSKKQKLLVVYLASPYSHKSKKIEHQRYEEVNRISAALHEKYKHAFIMPITQSHTMRKYNKNLGTSFEKWAARDLAFIDHSDEVFVLLMEGWKKSIGVTAEILHAKEKGIPIRYIDPHTLKIVSEKHARKYSE